MVMDCVCSPARVAVAVCSVTHKVVIIPNLKVGTKAITGADINVKADNSIIFVDRGAMLSRKSRVPSHCDSGSLPPPPVQKQDDSGRPPQPSRSPTPHGGGRSELNSLSRSSHRYTIGAASAPRTPNISTTSKLKIAGSRPDPKEHANTTAADQIYTSVKRKKKEGWCENNEFLLGEASPPPRKRRQYLVQDYGRADDPLQSPRIPRIYMYSSNL